MTVKPTDIASSVKSKKVAKVTTTLTKGQLRAVKNLAKAKARVKADKEKIDAYEAAIRLALGDAEVGLTEDGLKAVEIMHSKNTFHDRQVLTTRFPDAALASYQETPYTFVKVL
jgi:hypothetical protein